MRKLFIILAIIFAVLGIIFAILPLGTLGVLPVVLAILFGVLSFIKSDAEQKKLPKILLIISGLTLIVILGKSLIPDEVDKDDNFEQRKIESNDESLKDLEGLEDLE